MSALQIYTKALLDPFDKGMSQPKLLDGKAERSSGIRMRATGEITCNSTGATYIALFPGHSNVICWRDSSDVADVEKVPLPFRGHMDTTGDRSNIKSARVVGTALRLSLVNSADQNEGYWEAARIPTNKDDFEFHEDPLTPGTYDTSKFLVLSPTLDLSNYGTYQTGKLRDIHRYQFMLNAVDNDINFVKNFPTPALNVVNDYISEQWDTVVIKIHGRVEVSAPSMIMYDTISCQEILYKEDTALSRLMTTNPYIPETKDLLTKTRLPAPGTQIA